MTKYSDYILTGCEPCKDGSGNFYWYVKINGEVYADGEVDSREAAALKIILNLDEWKERNA